MTAASVWIWLSQQPNKTAERASHVDLAFNGMLYSFRPDPFRQLNSTDDGPVAEFYGYVDAIPPDAAATKHASKARDAIKANPPRAHIVGVAVFTVRIAEQSAHKLAALLKPYPGHWGKYRQYPLNDTYNCATFVMHMLELAGGCADDFTIPKRHSYTPAMHLNTYRQYKGRWILAEEEFGLDIVTGKLVRRHFKHRAGSDTTTAAARPDLTAGDDHVENE